jgi:hypothetical protein
MLQRPNGSARPGELLEGIFEMGTEEARAVRIVRERAVLRETRDAPLVSAAPPIPARIDEARARTDPACGSHVSRGDGDVSP